jgi:DNA ligase-associated metallophosphoesterase
MNITVAGQTLKLFPQRATLWMEEKTLVISDLHLGKIAHFRKEGFAVPSTGIANNFERLDQLILNNNVWKIIFTGDLFHSSHNYEWEIFCEWRDKYHSIDMHIVKGNHDRLPDHCYDGLNVHERDYVLSPFTFTHHPKENFKPGEFIMAGHLHPVVKLIDRTGHSFRFPCYYFSDQQLILPSFGYFTGGYVIQPYGKETVIAIVQDQLMDVSAVFTCE